MDGSYVQRSQCEFTRFIMSGRCLPPFTKYVFSDIRVCHFQTTFGKVCSAETVLGRHNVAGMSTILFLL